MQWQIKENRSGVFDGHTILGIKFESADGEIGWQITAWLTEVDPIHGYLVKNGNFYSASIQVFHMGTPVNIIEIYEPPITPQIEAAERRAVLHAIAAWEKGHHATST
jgi:hypothetical protein